jgi:hypothetical protein
MFRLLERRLARFLTRRWYDFDRKPPKLLVLVWGRLLRRVKR